MESQAEAKYRFEMRVADVFSFQDGRTVFSGEVVSGPGYIGPCEAELALAGRTQMQLKLEGEELPLRRANKNLRAVSTRERIEVALIEKHKDQWVLRGL